jgi:hypothetical protein
MSDLIPGATWWGRGDLGYVVGVAVRGAVLPVFGIAIGPGWGR